MSVSVADVEITSNLQKRTISVLSLAQITAGVGVAASAAVGALLTADLSTDALSGVGQSAAVIGTAVIAIPVSRFMNERGRRPGLLMAYGFGFAGVLLILTAAIFRLFPLALVGFFLAGGGQTATLQSRYAAADLASPAKRGRDLSIVVWATTIGSVAGPNLASPMGDLAEQIGVPRLAGPYLLTGTALVVSAIIVFIMLRPDPLLVARQLEQVASGAESVVVPKRRSIREGWDIIMGIPAAKVGLIAMAIGQAVMVAVMSMTPVHLKHGNEGLEIIGLVISIHIAGMYIASPLVGIASDRVGRRPIIVVGGFILLSAFLLAGTAAAQQTAQLSLGLFLLGLGWSCTMISGSTLLTESLPVGEKASIQGTADLVMGSAGATAGLTAGLIVGLGSYGLLNAIATLLVVPLIALALRSNRRLIPATG